MAAMAAPVPPGPVPPGHAAPVHACLAAAGTADGLGTVAARAAAEALAVLGAFHPGPGDGLPAAVGTLVLLGPREPGFWAHVTAQPEFADSRPDPLDRWSRRVIGRLACGLGAKAVFPFTGPPFRPFHAWALRTGRAWRSPVGLLVHETAGLMVSFRGALGLRARLALPPPPAAPPCAACAGQPCRTACPAGALTPAAYDVQACRGFLAGPDGAGCITAGCALRRACPASAGHARVPAQSAFHMRQFLR